MRRFLAPLLSVSLAAGAFVALAPGLAPPAAAATQVIPVPTSSAGLGRIVTAPDGNMWFTEEDANKVGRITPGGQITEFDLGEQTTDSSSVSDVAVATDGTIWVAYDSGWRVKAINSAGQTVRGPYVFSYPYAEQIAIAADGTPWVTMNYDEDFVIRIVGDQALANSNSPECQAAIARAADGAMWCRTDSGLTRLSGDASGGVTFPANNYAAYPYAIAAGPVGSIWFGRYFSGTMFTSPDDGEVGYLDANTGQIRAFNTGERTAPNSLLQGPDGNMWFTSVGAAAGIGHISAQGRGALTAIGGYEPESLTFAPDGAIFATDPTNNVILRVTTDELQRTNVDPGAGSVFTQNGGAVPTVVGKLAPPRKPVAVRKGRVPVTVACPKGDAACRGKVTLRTAKGKKVVARTAAYTVQPGKRKTVRLALTKPGKKVVRPGKVTKLRAELSAKGAKPVRKVIKVRR